MSQPYVGDFPASHTCVLLAFNSYDNDLSSPSDPVGFTSADVKIYKDGGTTERTSANGITVSNAFDGIVGFNLVKIDLSDDTDAGFYAAGSEYIVGIVDLTIDSIPARKWIGSFSIERAGGALALIKAIKTKTDKLPNVPLATGTVIDDAANSATTFKTDLTKNYRNAFLVFTSGALEGELARLSDVNTGTGFVTSSGYTAEPAAGDDFDIINK